MRLLTLLLAFVQYINAQITFTFDPVDPDNPSQDFVNDLIQNHLISSNGLVQFSSATFTGHKCFALFNNGLTAAPTWPDEGIIMSSGLPENVEGPNDDVGETNKFFLPGDADLEVLSGVSSKDACVIEFDFSCPDETDVFTPQINFNYVFASEEYPEFVDSSFNDVFAFFLNGENIALVPGTTDPVAINTVNNASNPEYFILNTVDNNQADGYTTLLTATGNPVPGTNTIKMAIADSKDSSYDSWVLLQAGTFSCIAPQPQPFESPTDSPTKNPTASPSKNPTESPTKIPTTSPSKNPTESPTKNPTPTPSKSPSQSPTESPTKNPTPSPTQTPSSSPVARPVVNLGQCETAFAYSETDSSCFKYITDEGSSFRRWGWNIGPLSAGSYSFNIYGGAGRCDPLKGVLVGTLSVNYSGATATVAYMTFPGVYWQEVQLYVGNDILPRKNGVYAISPGQYPNQVDPADSFTEEIVEEGLSGDVYVVAHATVCPGSPN